MKRIALSISITIFILLVGYRIYQSTAFELPTYQYVEAVEIIQEENIPLSKPILFDKKVTDVNWDSVKAKSIYAFNPVSGQVYYKRDIDTKRPIASITKLMTALVTYNIYSMDDVITVKVPTGQTERVLGLSVGDKVSVRELLEAGLVNSKNDATVVIANAYGYNNFISKMNETATILGMQNTHFSNTNGLLNTDNYSTAKELGLLSSVFIKNQELVDITSSKSARIDIKGVNPRFVTVYSTNELLSQNKNAKGLKTGFTYQSGECLVMYYKVSEEDQLITVVLNSTDRFGESKKLYEMINQAFD